MKTIVLKYGSAIGLVIGSFMVITFMVSDGDGNLATGETIGYSVMFLAFASMFFGIRSYRDNYCDGVISFGRALAVGLLIALLASSIYSLLWTVYTEITGFDYMAMYRDMKLKELNEAGASQAIIDAELETIEGYVGIYKNPLLKFLFTIVEPLPPSILVSLFSALMLKKKVAGQA